MKMVRKKRMILFTILALTIPAALVALTIQIEASWSSQQFINDVNVNADSEVRTWATSPTSSVGDTFKARFNNNYEQTYRLVSKTSSTCCTFVQGSTTVIDTSC